LKKDTASRPTEILVQQKVYGLTEILVQQKMYWVTEILVQGKFQYTDKALGAADRNSGTK
jgi:hypothetical protein